MTALQFLAEWTLRSSILILGGALLLRTLRVKDSSVRLVAWTGMLAVSLTLPALTAALPRMSLTFVQIPRISARPVEAPAAISDALLAPKNAVSRPAVPGHDRALAIPHWSSAAVILYSAVAGALLLRLFAGLAMSLRLLRGSRATGQATEGIDIRESDLIGSPLVLGIARSAIVLPGDWREWAGAKLDAVLAHERSHIRRHDPAVQVLSAIHRALLWHSPLSWFLHQRLVRVAEEASDDAALTITRDRASYAEVVLDFVQRGVRSASWHGVAMARYGRADERIHRILDGTVRSCGVTRWSVAAILAFGSPLAYVVSTAHPPNEPQLRTPITPAIVQATAQKPLPVEALAIKPGGQIPGAAIPQIRSQIPDAAPPPEGAAVILIVDRSSSMQGRKLELARLAAASVVKNLTPIDTVGVLTFDNSFAWAVTPRHPEDRAMINRLLSGITADGGTQIAPALTEAYMRVLPLSATYKHIVLLTDGISAEGDSMDVARSANGTKVTISTVGLGQDVNRAYLERIAQVAGGKSYFLSDPQELEQILLRDVREHTGSTAVETAN